MRINNIFKYCEKRIYVRELKKSYSALSYIFKNIMKTSSDNDISKTVLWSKIPTSIDDIYAEDLQKKECKDFKDEFLKTFDVTSVYGDENFPAEFDPNYKGLDGREFGTFSEGVVYLKDKTLMWFSFSRRPRTAYCNNFPCKTLDDYQKSRKAPVKFWIEAGFVVLDVNGVKGPNVMGRDLFALSGDGILYPIGSKDYAIFAGEGACDYNNLGTCMRYWNSDDDYVSCRRWGRSEGDGCAGRIIEEGWKMKY